MKTPHKHMNSYLAGFLLGLLLTLTIYVTGRGLGASGAMQSATIAAVETVAPGQTETPNTRKNTPAVR